MSASNKAKPLGKEGWLNQDGSQADPEKLPAFTCQECGHQGKAYDLLAEEDDDNMYCPGCGLMNWIWD